jgi:hypothetical protein
MINTVFYNKIRSDRDLCYLMVCLTNSPLFDEKYFCEAIKNSQLMFEQVNIVICDTLNYHNNIAFHRCSELKALKRATNDGNKIHDMLSEWLTKHDMQNVNILKWDDIKTRKYLQQINIMRNDTSPEQKKLLTKLANEFYTFRRNILCKKENKLNSIKNYIMEELPSLHGFLNDNKHWVVYPCYANKRNLDIFFKFVNSFGEEDVAYIEFQFDQNN